MSHAVEERLVRIGLVICFIGLLGAALMLGEALNRLLRRLRYERLTSTVKVGDLWEHVGPLSMHDEPGYRCFEVIAPIDPDRDSPWEMRAANGHPRLMFDGARLRGHWLLVMRDGKPTSPPRRATSPYRVAAARPSRVIPVRVPDDVTKVVRR